MGVTDNGLFDIYYSSPQKLLYLFGFQRSPSRSNPRTIMFQKPLQHPLPTSLAVKCISESQQSIHTSISKWKAFSSSFFPYPKLVDIFPNISSIKFKNNKQHLSTHYTLNIMTPISFMRNQNVVSVAQHFAFISKG